MSPRREPRRPPRRDEPPEPPARRRGGSLLADFALLAAVFAGTSAVAELAGAANLGVALGIGQIAFALTLVWVLLKR